MLRSLRFGILACALMSAGAFASVDVAQSSNQSMSADQKLFDDAAEICDTAELPENPCVNDVAESLHNAMLQGASRIITGQSRLDARGALTLAIATFKQAGADSDLDQIKELEIDWSSWYLYGEDHSDNQAIQSEVKEMANGIKDWDDGSGVGSERKIVGSGRSKKANHPKSTH